MCLGGFKNPALFLHWLIFGLEVRNVPFPSLWNNYITSVLPSPWKPIKNCKTGWRSRPCLIASVISMNFTVPGDSWQPSCEVCRHCHCTRPRCRWWLQEGHLSLSLQIPVILVCRCHREGVSWRSPTIWMGTVMSSSNPRSWSTRSRTRGTTRTCTESCSWTRRGQETPKKSAWDASSLSKA